MSWECFPVTLSSFTRGGIFYETGVEIERENVGRINQELESRVIKRTEDYRMLNRALQQEVVGHEQAAKALRESEERYRALVENANDIVLRTDGKDVLPLPMHP